MFLNVSIKSILKCKWLWIAVILGVIIASFIILKGVDKLILGDKILSENISPFEINSYYAEYDMTIVSNKNINTYFVKEWFELRNHKFEFLDKMNNVVEIIINDKKIYINNVNEKNKLTLNNLKYGNNVTSFSTLIAIYNCIKKTDNSCECNISQYEKNGKINAYIEFNKGKKCKCEVCNSLTENNIENIMIEIDKNNKVPLGFTVYDKDKNTISSIVYTKFEMNIEIEDNLFIIS